MNITLHIERLVLDGVSVPVHQLDAVRAGVETELARLLAVQGLPPEVVAEGARPALSGGALRLQPAINPLQLGMHIGEAIHNGFVDASAKGERTDAR